MLEGYPSTDYFCIHVLITPAVVKVYPAAHNTSYSNAPLQLQYSYDKVNWQTLSDGVNNINVSNCVYFRSTKEHVVWSGAFLCNKPYYVSGKLSTLINPDPTLTQVHFPVNGFNYLFGNMPNTILPEGFHTKYLYSAKYLLFDNLIDDLGGVTDNTNTKGKLYRLFWQCIGLITPPDYIDPINITPYMCYEMFRSSEISSIPTLSVTNLGEKTMTRYYGN